MLNDCIKAMPNA